MARGRKRSLSNSSMAAGRGRLVPAYPSNPSRPTQVCLYLKRGDRQQCYPFYGIYAAKKTFDYLTRGVEYRWEEVDRIVTDDGLEIKAVGEAGRTALEKIVEHVYTPAEEEWELGDYQCRCLDAIRVDIPPERLTVEGTLAPVKKSPKPERTPRPSRDGLVAVGDIAKQLGIEPREARGILRSLKLPKPEAGWAWPAAEAEKIAAQIKGAM